MVGIGYVHLQIQNGTIKVLRSIRYVPGLKRNLVSLGMLDESGYICKTENGTIKITKRPYIAMKGIKKNGLYILLGKSVTKSCNAYVSF